MSQRGDAPALHLFSPSGAVAKAATLRLAARRLTSLGFTVLIDEAALLRQQRFGGDDAQRLAAVHRVAQAAPAVAMATRGGYGMTRLLDVIDWKLVARSVERGTRWVGHSDFTAFQLAALAHGGIGTWAGPMACYDFGRLAEEHGEREVEEVDEVTAGCFVEAMDGSLEAVGFRTEDGFEGLDVRGTLWGGNLAMIVSLLGTRHWPKIKGGILFIEDVNEPPYSYDRMLTHLRRVGALAGIAGVAVGQLVGAGPPGELDVPAGLRDRLGDLGVPVLGGLPLGHGTGQLTVPLGVPATIDVAAGTLTVEPGVR